MKKLYLLILSVCIIVIICACSEENAPETTEKPIVTATTNATEEIPTEKVTPLVTISPSPKPTEIINHIIEGFDDMTNPVEDMKPMDLSRWSIENPLLSIVTENAEEGKAMKVELNPNRWCQAYQIDDSERLSVFTEKAEEKYFLKLYVHNPGSISLGVTINLTNDENSSFPDSSVAILTDTDGNTIETTTGNATDDAGADSSITVPGDFTGWIAWPLDSLKPWSAHSGITDFTVSYIRIDIRPVQPVEGDFYVIDNFCISNVVYGK